MARVYFMNITSDMDVALTDACLFIL